MRFLGPVAFILGLSAVPSYAQQLPQNLVPEAGQVYVCQGKVKGLDGKESDAIVHVSRSPYSDSQVLVGFGRPQAGAPAGKEWEYALSKVTFTVNKSGDIYALGDDYVDSVYIQDTRQSTGWNAEKKGTDIAENHVASFNSAVAAAKSCRK